MCINDVVVIAIIIYRKYPKSLLEHGHITCQQVYITARYASRNIVSHR